MSLQKMLKNMVLFGEKEGKKWRTTAFMVEAQTQKSSRHELKNMKYYSDGFLRGSKNPSLLGGGYTVVDENNSLIKRETFERAGFTNNEGEILGILAAARIADISDSISTDSMCCLAWANVGRSKARPDLNPILSECAALIADKHINLMWERRDFNLAGIFNEQEQMARRKERRKLNKHNMFDDRTFVPESKVEAPAVVDEVAEVDPDAWAKSKGIY